MSRIVFFCIPAHGHTNPTLGVVRELICRGHQVWYYSYEAFREKIEQTGATFVGCDGCDAQQKLKPSDGARIAKDLAFSTRILVDTTLALGEKLEKELAEIRPDCIVADSMAVWGKAAALKHGIPFVSSTTTFAFNQHSARVMKQGLGDLFGMLWSMPKANRQIKRLQNNGYPVKSILDIIQNDEHTHTIVYTSRFFQPCADTFSDRYAFVGPVLREPEMEVEKTGEKLIYISMGTVNNDFLPFYQNCIKAFAQTPYQVILSVGGQIDMQSFLNVPSHISVCQSVDQIAVLQKADVFLTHCGMNSVSEALYFGTPLVLFPQTNEQKGVARRVRELGAGTMLVQTDPTSIRKAVEQVMCDPSCAQNAARIADSFAKCSGANGAADKILSVCSRRAEQVQPL